MTHEPPTVRIDNGGWISGPCLFLPAGTRDLLSALRDALDLPLHDERLPGRVSMCAGALRAAEDACTDDDLHHLAAILRGQLEITS